VKRLILVLAVASLVAMVPAATAGSAPISAQATNASVYVINTCGTAAAGCAPGAGTAVDVWSGTTKIITNLAYSSAVTLSIPAGTANYVTCAPSSTDNTCAGSTPAVPLLSGALTTVGGTNVTAVIGPGGVAQFTNDISPTANGQARFTFHNDDGATIYLCLNGAPVPGTTWATAGIAVGASGEAEVPASVPASLTVSIGVPIPTCAGTAKALPGLAAGTNSVSTATLDAACTTSCFQIIQVDQTRPTNSAATAAFCTSLTTLQGLKAEIKSVLGNAVAVHPSTAAVQTLVTDINNALAAGDASVLASVKPQWETATSGLRQLAEGLTSAGFDVSLIPTAQLQTIQDGANGVNQAANPAGDAATAVLTNFFLTNCVPTTVTLKFTG
jgi:hypothetical protein